MNTISPAPPQSGRLSQEALSVLEELGHRVNFGDGCFIVRRGDAGRNFFVVLSGEVEIRLAGTGGASLPLARLGEGATFGEMALILQKTVSADVVAVGETILLACPELEFRQAMAQCEPLRVQLLARLARDLQHTTSEAWDFFQRAEALRLLIRCESRAEPLVTDSAPMRNLVRSLETVAQGTNPCLIIGEPGAGKLLVARRLHELAHGESAPLIIVDCRRLRDADQRRLLLGPPGREAEGVLHGLGALHLARGGSLVLRHIETLDDSFQAELADALSSSAPGAARLIATFRTTGTLDQKSEILNSELAAIIAEHTITVPSLRQRRRDIVNLAALFLSQIENSEQKLSHTAKNTLVSMDFQRGNGTQLRETVEFAARCTEDDEIRSEHIFSGIETGERSPGIDLGPLHGLQFLLKQHSLTVIRAVFLVGFALTTALCLVKADSLAGRTANGFIWSVWEPLIFALFLFAGSLWCTVCPLSTAGRAVRRIISFDKPPPERLKRWSVWLMITSFFAIMWAEQVFHMTRSPVATGLMLLSLVLASMFFCAVFAREVWCRYVCPLGALATSLAPSAPLGIGARSGVCTSTCTSHSCYKGEGQIPGCSVFHHPLNAAENHHCKLCLDCLKSCPHDSARLFLRPPLAGIWKMEGSSVAFAPFAVAVFLLAIVFLAAQTQAWPTSPLALTFVGLGAIALGAVFSRLLPSLLIRGSRDSDEPKDSRVGVQVSFALMLLGWGPLMAYQLGNIPLLADLKLEPTPMSSWARLSLPASWTLMATVQVAVVLVAAGITLIALARIQRLAKGRGTQISSFGWAALTAICTAYLVIALRLVA